jgi:hypothetical protein
MRLWWRRQMVNRRQGTSSWLIVSCLTLLFICIFVPNPFSSRYYRLELRQDVQWQMVQESFKMKEQVKHARSESTGSIPAYMKILPILSVSIAFKDS